MSQVVISGNSTATLANTDSANNINMTFPGNLVQAGSSLPVTSSHDVGVLASVDRGTRSSLNGRLRIGMDRLLWHDNMINRNDATPFDSGIYNYQTSNYTFSGLVFGGLAFNSGQSTTHSSVCYLQTYRTFRTVGSSSLQADFRILLNLPPVANTVMEWGLGFATPDNVAPTDGIFFRITASGLEGIVNRGGVEIAVPLLTVQLANRSNHYSMLVNADRAEFYVNGALEGAIASPVERLTLSNGLPVTVRQYTKTNLAPVVANILLLEEIAVSAIDLASPSSWIGGRALAGESGINQSRGNGASTAQSVNYVNNTAPASAVLSNGVQGYNSSLGGQWQFAAVAGAETDYELFDMNPDNSSFSLYKHHGNYVITGVHITSYVTGVTVATTPTLLQWAISVGGTSNNLAITDSGSSGARGARRLTIGTQSIPVGAVVGASIPDLDVRFLSPLYTEPISGIAIILKIPKATATGSLVIRGTIEINGYYE